MATPSTPTDPQRFDFAFDDRYRIAGRVFGIHPTRAWVEVDGETLEARFGPWVVRTALTNVVDASVTGPYGTAKTIGPAHLSLADGGLTFASNGDRGVCLTFEHLVAGMDPLGLLRHPGLTVTVAEAQALVDALRHHSPVRTELEELQHVQTAQDHLHTMTARQLRELADDHGIAHTSSMKKAELVAVLHAGLGPDLLAELAADA